MNQKENNIDDMNYPRIANSKFLTHRAYSDKSRDYNERDEFQHDRDRIIHSRAFRRLMHKTQIFNANKGDHFRNRLTHTLEVMQIGRSIGRLLHLNEDLIEAIALGHDLGHTPFGHIGERTLNEIMNKGISGEEVPAIGQGFKHNFQSVRVVDNIESRCDEYNGINLTLAVREGMIKHTKLTMHGEKIIYTPVDLNVEQLRMDLSHSITLEGQVVAIADEIAQLTHDIEDGVRGNIIPFNKFLECELVRTYREDPLTTKLEPTTYNNKNQIIKGLVGFLINDVKNASLKNIKKYHEKQGIPQFKDSTSVYQEKCINFSEDKDIINQAEKLSKSTTNWIIFSQEISQADSKAEYFIKQIFRAYFKHPKELPDYILGRYFNLKNFENLDRSLIDKEMMQKDPRFVRLICDHIAGMSDQFAAREYINLYQPDYF
ncbi:dGTP triphosphohydrolase [Anaerotignum sp.]|uniref:dGTP triphosphohydrolase n=1 Tax=Anaerotignum sp. TaxID=2039241 RepID=UPI00289BA299|nr:dNTP triphosphohydrolase [Anaerotignum sp.]